MFGELLQLLALGIHGPEVHGAVAIGDEINALSPPHRRLAGAGEILGKRAGLGLAGSVFPQMLNGSALVTFGAAALEWQARKVECFARGIEYAIARLAQGQQRLLAGLEVNRGELPIRQG